MSDPIVIFGATGNMGGAALNALLRRGQPVRAVTRDPGSKGARELARLGAEVVAGDYEDRASLDRVLAGCTRVFSVQSWQHAGIDGEVRQGKALADAAAAARVQHLVYGSAGIGQRGTGVAHFECKLEVEEHMRALGLPLTIIRPSPFMELMTDPSFYPQVGVWGGERRIVGWERPIPWVACRDIGEAVAQAFLDPAQWVGQDITLVGDIQSLGEARELHRQALGRNPSSWPLPLWVIGMLAGTDLIDMWRWMVPWLDAAGREALEAHAQRTRELVPEPTSMSDFYAAQ